jgi:hypothetical protein
MDTKTVLPEPLFVRYPGLTKIRQNHKRWAFTINATIICLYEAISGGSRIEKSHTSHNKAVYATPPVGGSGFRFARSAAPPTLHSTHIWAGLQTYGLLIRPAQTSYTARTLCEMRAKIS